jgi:phospholipase C
MPKARLGAGVSNQRSDYNERMAVTGLMAIDHFVVLMLENRSFDNVLGFLYPKSDQFDGLDGTESNADSVGTEHRIFQLTAAMPNHDFYPLADPGEGYQATNEQLFSSASPPTPPLATNRGFVTNFESWLPRRTGDTLEGASPQAIMGMYPPLLLPILSGLAKGYAVSDTWFASVPTQTVPNRTFALAGTSLGCVENREYNALRPTQKIARSVFGALSALDDPAVTWKIYTAGDVAHCYTALNFQDTLAPSVQKEHIGTLAQLQADAASGALPSFSFIEPNFGTYSASETPTQVEANLEVQNDQHPVSSLTMGEQLLYKVYEALRTGPGWGTTLLLVTYDEHGGNFDHAAPPTNATPPDGIVGPSGFDFRRLGVRVPAVLVSPLIPQGTILRPPSAVPFDHTSILATIRTRFGIANLTARDLAAPDVGGALTLGSPRTDDPLVAVQPLTYAPPTGVGAAGVGTAPSSILEAYTSAVASLPVAGVPIAHPEQVVAGLHSASAQLAFIHERLGRWYGEAP